MAAKVYKQALAHLRLKSRNKPYFIQVHLWPSLKVLHTTITREMKWKDKQAATNWTAICVTNYLENLSTGKLSVGRCLADLHFASNEWSTEIVAHEVFHAMLHRMRFLKPNATTVLVHEENPAYYLDDEETLAYEAGEWTAQILAWLLNNDPATAEC